MMPPQQMDDDVDDQQQEQTSLSECTCAVPERKLKRSCCKNCAEYEPDAVNDSDYKQNNSWNECTCEELQQEQSSLSECTCAVPDGTTKRSCCRNCAEYQSDAVTGSDYTQDSSWNKCSCEQLEQEETCYKPMSREECRKESITGVEYDYQMESDIDLATGDRQRPTILLIVVNKSCQQETANEQCMSHCSNMCQECENNWDDSPRHTGNCLVPNNSLSSYNQSQRAESSRQSSLIDGYNSCSTYDPSEPLNPSTASCNSNLDPEPPAADIEWHCNRECYCGLDGEQLERTLNQLIPNEECLMFLTNMSRKNGKKKKRKQKTRIIYDRFAGPPYVIEPKPTCCPNWGCRPSNCYYPCCPARCCNSNYFWC